MRKVAYTIGLLVIGGAAVAVFRQASQLFINGDLASSGVIERNGISYVPVKDVAAALHMSTTKTSRGIELVAAGGANQIEGITGKIGDVLFNGYVRFQVLKVLRQPTYTRQFSPDTGPVMPIGAGNDLVIVVCRMKNATQKASTPGLVGGLANALTDTEGHSYEPRRTSDLPVAQDLLPGAAVDFALIFEVPPRAKLQDLVYEANLVYGSEKKKFRVSLGDGS